MLVYSNHLKFLKNYISLCLPKFILSVEYSYNQLFITVSPYHIREVLLFLRDNSNCLFKTMVDIVGIDYLGRKNRFEVVYCLLSYKYNSRVYIKCSVDEASVVPSSTSLFGNANWFEREVWDMYGVLFSYHSDLRRILTDYGFKGHPLRKDFSLSGYVEVVFDNITRQVQYRPSKLSQEFRSYSYKLPWGHSLTELDSTRVLLFNSYRFVLHNSLSKYCVIK